MAFFRKWKTHYKHKKFTSIDEMADSEDWQINKNPISDLKKKHQNPRHTEINFDDITAKPLHENIMNHHDSHDHDSDDDIQDNKLLFQTYDIKYLGCTPIEKKRSQKVTSEAIKTVIANAKAGGRKLKTQKNVKLNITQDGLDVLDYTTKETLMRFSIYKISYCSVDAAHDHAFSFVSSEPDPLSDKEKMSCHVFLCPKRKIAHEITLLVARCFENAYQNWRDTVLEQQQEQEPPHSTTQIALNNRKILKESNNFIKSKVDIHYPPPDLDSDNSLQQIDNNPLPLIDFVSSDNNNENNKNNKNDVRTYIQSTWVSFDSEQQQQQQQEQQKQEGFSITAY